jgi:diaminopimelate epimerase
MEIEFYKYQGTGNDFVMLDNRKGVYDQLTLNQIQLLCDRKFGVGADGLIKIDASTEVDFTMDYYNSDGSKSFCGNGARCSLAFFSFLEKNKKNDFSFKAIDGIHEGQVKDLVSLRMADVEGINLYSDSYCLNTGSPHYVSFVTSVNNLNVYDLGRTVRYSEKYFEKGINVNFVEEKDSDVLFVRTYERGVEDETLSCGTGVTASALSYFLSKGKIEHCSADIQTLGGNLKVEAVHKGEGIFSSIKLIGPAKLVFKGEINV